jgi:uncharacterized protein HemX
MTASNALARAALLAVLLLAGCAGGLPWTGAGDARTQAEPRTQDELRAENERLKAQLAAEVAERQRQARAAARREETLRRQLDAMKGIERGILDREDRIRTEAR